MESSNWSTPSDMSSTRAQLEAFLPGKTTDLTSERRYSRDFRTLDYEAGMKSIIQQEQEVRALQRALNLPQAPVLPTSLMTPDISSFNGLLSSSTRQTRIVTETDLKTKTDSLYMYNMENPVRNSVNHTEQSYHDFHRKLNRSRGGTPLSASSSVQVSGGGASHHYHNGGEGSILRSSKLSDSHFWNPRKTTVIGHGYWDEFDNTKTRDCLTENCIGSGGDSMLDKVKEAQLVIEHQNEVIARAENKISDLQGELRKIVLDKEICEEEIMTMKKEREYFNGITSKGTKKRQELLTRLNQLDQNFRELNISHNALLVESKKKEADLLQVGLRLNALEECNNNLQQVNKKILNEQKLAQKQIDQLLSDQKVLRTEKQQAKGETATVLQENKRLADEIATLNTRCTELNAQLWHQNTGHRKLIQELEELKMEYELKCNRVGLLEEEVKQQQETFELLNNEQENSLKRNIEQIYRNKEALYLDKIRKLAENKDMLQRRCQDLLQKNMQLENGSETTEFPKPGALNTDTTTEKQTVSSLSRQVDQLMIENSNLALKNHEVESLREELSQSHDEQTRLLEQLESIHKGHTRALNENKSLKEQLDYSQSVQAQLEKGIQDLSSSNEVLYSEVVDLKQNEKKSQSITELQESLKQIRRKIMSLEEEKCDLMSNLQELQQDRDLWSKEKKEVMLSLAELNAENSKMRDQIKESSNQASTEALSHELKTIKQELDKLHKMLRLKDEELETQTNKLQDTHTQLNRLNKENTQLKKSFADIASKTSARNLVISTLRDQLEEQTQRINELEHELVSKNHEYEDLNTRYSKLEIELCQPSPKAMRWINSERNTLEAERDLFKIQVFELKFRLNECESKNGDAEEMLSLESTNTDLSVRRKSDGCLTRRISSHHGRLSKNVDGVRALKQENTKLKVRLDELVAERNSVLQDSEDLIEGMQQLKEAFEDEIERRLEKVKLNCDNG